MDKLTAAYIAGLMDGEGCFYVERFATKRSYLGYQYRIIATITMCDLDTIKFVCKATRKKYRTRAGLTKGGRTAYTIDWRNSVAANLIEVIFPYLKGKKEQAKLCLKFDRTLSPGRGKRYTEKQAKQCEIIRLRLKELKLPNALRC